MASAQFSLSYMEGSSVLHRLYPLVKLAWVFLVAMGLFIFKTPVPGAVMLVVVLFLALGVAKVPLKKVLGSSKYIFGLGLILMFFHFFANPGEAVFRMGPLTVTDVGLREGPIFFFRLSVVVLSSFVLIWTTDIRDLMVSLTQAGVPYRFAFAVFLALRFLPLAQREVDAVRSAHAIRGQTMRSNMLHRFKLWQRYVFTVLVNGLRKAEITSTALECRGFGAFPDRTYVKTVSFQRGDLWLIGIFVLVQASLIYMERVGIISFG
jgi:energy-coupling factor transport system permease protein